MIYAVMHLLMQNPCISLLNRQLPLCCTEC